MPASRSGGSPKGCTQLAGSQRRTRRSSCFSVLAYRHTSLKSSRDLPLIQPVRAERVPRQFPEEQLASYTQVWAERPSRSPRVAAAETEERHRRATMAEHPPQRVHDGARLAWRRLPKTSKKRRYYGFVGRRARRASPRTGEPAYFAARLVREGKLYSGARRSPLCPTKTGSPRRMIFIGRPRSCPPVEEEAAEKPLAEGHQAGS